MNGKGIIDPTGPASEVVDRDLGARVADTVAATIRTDGGVPTPVWLHMWACRGCLRMQDRNPTGECAYCGHTHGHEFIHRQVEYVIKSGEKGSDLEANSVTPSTRLAAHKPKDGNA